jgi:1-acyl-sn-glycerol-3-phosphate acyltransferase
MTVLLRQRVIHRPEFYSRYRDQPDEFGFNSETIKRWQPFLQFLFEGYFEVRTIGVENIPDCGRAVLVGNHGGVLPVDAFMTFMAVLLQHHSPRRIRCLSHNFLRSNRFVKDLVCGFGGVPDKYSVAKKLLENDELVHFYPEGARGTGKHFSMRYRLCDFNPGFVKAAITTGSPIIPITTFGCDEIYPLLGNLKSVARLLGAPYWPITLTGPWFPFITSCVPLPIKLLIKVGEPLTLNYPPEKASDRQLLLRVTRSVQFDMQRELNSLLHQRISPFRGWDLDAVKSIKS